jgi:hydrogenase-4 membrane subunit HyfE
MGHLAFDTAHLLAGGLVLVSFILLYQDRLYSLLNIYALHASVLAAAVAWQADIQNASASAFIARSKAWSAPVSPCWAGWRWWRSRWS